MQPRPRSDPSTRGNSFQTSEITSVDGTFLAGTVFENCTAKLGV